MLLHEKKFNPPARPYTDIKAIIFIIDQFKTYFNT